MRPSRMLTHWLCSAALLTGMLRTAAQTTGIAFYDVDRLYDTVPALFYDDSDHTPRGRLRWTSERYERRIRRTAAVIDSMALPLVALWGVENEMVVRDLAAACRGDYSYLHCTLNSLDGLDFALLYHGDRFFPEHTEPGRRYLYIEGTLGRDTVGLVLSADTHMSRWVVRDLRQERPHAKLIVAGRSASLRAEEFGLRDAHAHAARAGRGTVRRRGRWEMRDRILVDTALRCAGGDVYIRRFLLDPRTGTPLSCYAAGSYRDGYGSSLPVYVYLIAE